MLSELSAMSNFVHLNADLFNQISQIHKQPAQSWTDNYGTHYVISV